MVRPICISLPFTSFGKKGRKEGRKCRLVAFSSGRESEGHHISFVERRRCRSGAMTKAMKEKLATVQVAEVSLGGVYTSKRKNAEQEGRS